MATNVLRVHPPLARPVLTIYCRYAFDVIGELYFGKTFGFMEDRHDYGQYIQALDTLMPPMVVASTSASYARPFILGSAILIPAARSAIKALNLIATAAKRCVSQRFEDVKAGKEVRHDMTDQMIEIYRENGAKLDFTLHDIEQEAYVAL